ncbi:MAG: T9SS type A sorting domain-containing protein [Bacteroidota bacterium]
MRKWLIWLVLLASGTPAFAQANLKIMHYNLLNFGDCSGVTVQEKYSWLGTILDHYRPDIFTVNELHPNQIFTNGIKSLSFSYSNQIAAPTFTNEANSPIVNNIFYNEGLLDLTDSEVIANSLRDINVYQLYVKGTGTGSSTDSVFIYCIVAHFKAQNNSSAASQRAAAATSIMNWRNAHPEAEYVLMMGDLNVYAASEAAFQTLVFNSNSTIRFEDPAGLENGWNGSSNAIHHTQSTRNSSSDCGSGGGMDDRFDMILASQPMMDGNHPVQYVTDSYAAYGNIGTSYNSQLTCTGSIPVPFTVCLNLRRMSDHLPVIMEVSVAGAVGLADRLWQKDLNLRLPKQPFTESLSVIWDIDEPTNRNLEARIFNPMGQAVYQNRIEGGQAQVNLSQVPAGVYILQLKNQAGRLIQKKIWKQA